METVRAWKDPYYRRGMGGTALMEHPAGPVSIVEPLQAGTEGIEARFSTTILECTCGPTLVWYCG